MCEDAHKVFVQAVHLQPHSRHQGDTVSRPPGTGLSSEQ